jgi:UDP-galactose transporter B1
VKGVLKAKEEPYQNKMKKQAGIKKQANGASHQLDGAVHSIEKEMEAQAQSLARNPQEQQEAGLFQLLICVGGIYASL